MAPSRLFLRFPLPPALRTQTLKVLSEIDRAADATGHAGKLASLVLALTEAGMDFYFLEGVRNAKLGFVARQTASLGISGAVRVMSPIVGSILGAADAGQLKAVARHVRRLME